jgi:hypothetical protein
LRARADWKRNGRIITAGARNKNNPRQTDKANVRATAKDFLSADWISGIIATGHIEDKILIFWRLLTIENRLRGMHHQGAVRYAHVSVNSDADGGAISSCG